MNKKNLILIIVIIAIAVGIIVAMSFKTGKENLPVPAGKPAAEVGTQPSVKEDSTAVINQELESIENIDLDKEFKTIDADLQNL